MDYCRKENIIGGKEVPVKLAPAMEPKASAQPLDKMEKLQS